MLKEWQQLIEPASFTKGEHTKTVFFGNSRIFCKRSNTGSKNFYFFFITCTTFFSPSNLLFSRLLYSSFHACLQSCLNSSKIITKRAIALNEVCTVLEFSLKNDTFVIILFICGGSNFWLVNNTHHSFIVYSKWRKEKCLFACFPTFHQKQQQKS